MVKKYIRIFIYYLYIIKITISRISRENTRKKRYFFDFISIIFTALFGGEAFKKNDTII